MNEFENITAMTPLDSLDYRGVHIDFYDDRLGDQAVAIWNNKLIEFGNDNTQFAEDMRTLIDVQLDTIMRFPAFPGARLEWFNNGGSRDIRLVRWHRIVRVYLIDGFESTDFDSLKYDAAQMLIVVYSENNL